MILVQMCTNKVAWRATKPDTIFTRIREMRGVISGVDPDKMGITTNAEDVHDVTTINSRGLDRCHHDSQKQLPNDKGHKDDENEAGLKV